MPGAAAVCTSSGVHPELAVPKRIWFRGTVMNITILGICSFLAPGLWGAMNSLGAGGAQKPYLVNAGNSLTFGLMVLSCTFSPILVRLIGIKYTLMLGTLGYSVFSAGLYCNLRFGTEWLVLFGAACCGVCAGIFWMSEAAIAMSYPERHRRARLLSYWLAYRVTGQMVGGAINLGLNSKRDERGAVGYKTYLVFISLQCSGPLFAALLSPPEKVQRTDNTPVRLYVDMTAREELREMWRLLRTKEVLCLIPLIVNSAYSEAFTGTYLTDYFTVRARALVSFLSAWTCIIVNFALGYFLDLKKYRIHFRAQAAFIALYTGSGAWWVYSQVIQHEYDRTKPLLDWSTPGFGRGFVLYILITTWFQLLYNFTYWIVSTLYTEPANLVRISAIVRGVESAGQAVSYGITSTKWTLQGASAINFGVWGVAVIPAWLVIRKLGTEPWDGLASEELEETEGRAGGAVEKGVGERR